MNPWRILTCSRLCKAFVLQGKEQCLHHTAQVKERSGSIFVVWICISHNMRLVTLCLYPPPASFLPDGSRCVYPCLLLTLQVLEGQRHDAACSSGSHQALDVGCGQGEDESLLPSQVSACVEGDEDGLVHARSRSWHHAAHCVSQLLGYKERLQNTHKHTTNINTGRAAADWKPLMWTTPSKYPHHDHYPQYHQGCCKVQGLMKRICTSCSTADATGATVSLINTFSCFADEFGASLCHRLTVKTHRRRCWRRSNLIFVEEPRIFLSQRCAVIYVSSHWTNPGATGLCLKYTALRLF